MIGFPLLPSSFDFASASSVGVAPGKGVLCASSESFVAKPVLFFCASEYPSGRDHQLRQPNVLVGSVPVVFLAGSGGNGGSLMVGGAGFEASSGCVGCDSAG